MEQENFFNRYSDIPSDLIEGNLDEKTCEFSFLIPAYKNPRVLRRLLEAIFAQKDCPKFEILITDDSEEEAVKIHEVIREFIGKSINIFYYKNKKRLGLFGNWNRAYELARSEYCCFFNHDDAPTPDYLARVSKSLSGGGYRFVTRWYKYNSRRSY